MVFNWHKTFGLIAGRADPLPLLVAQREPAADPAAGGAAVGGAPRQHRPPRTLRLHVPDAGVRLPRLQLPPQGLRRSKLFDAVQLPVIGWPSEELYALFKGTHEAVASVLVVLIALHVLAAFKHLFSGNGVFRRMVP
jgi:hypothetical protein